MATSRFLTVSQIGDLVEGYDPGGCAEEQDAFRRMFERDKAYLREIGIPLETGTDSAFSDEVGYRIRRGDYALADIALDADEAAALALAGSLWSSTALAGPAASALRKLAAGGAAVGGSGLGGSGLGGSGLDGSGPGGTGFGVLDGLEPRIDATEPAFEQCLTAVQTARAIRFPYRKIGESDVAERYVEPWGVLSWRGRWYLAGYDQRRRAPRVFRLSRFTGPVRMAGPAGAVRVPADVDLRAMVSAQAPPDRIRTATLAVRRGCGHGLRRHARPVAPAGVPGADAPAPAASASDTSGPDTSASHAPASDASFLDASSRDPLERDLLELDFTDTERFARWIVGAGPDVVVLGPPDLRAAVVGRLRAALAGTAAALDPPRPADPRRGGAPVSAG